VGLALAERPACLVSGRSQIRILSAKTLLLLSQQDLNKAMTWTFHLIIVISYIKQLGLIGRPMYSSELAAERSRKRTPSREHT
jgi:hypothetical protein